MAVLDSTIINGNLTTNGSVIINSELILNDKLTVSGDITANSSLNVTNNITATNIYASSDERLKENIKLAKLNCGKIIDNLQIKEFNFKADKDKKIIVGAIAQELKALLPEKYQAELVGKDDNGYYSINEGKLLYIAIGALKEEKEKIKDLEERIEKLEKILEK